MRVLKYAILGLLNRQPMTGYDIGKEFNYELSEFWHAKHSQIYTELKRLHDEGLVTYDIEISGDILEKTPGGLDAVIGAKGVYLSGGEMQRIALARAILKDAPIVVLDEASSFADPENEAKIQKAFETLMKGKTVLMIAHRLSTVRNMDRILVVRDGEIAEEGKHDELLQKGGVYAAMWEEYQKAAQWKVGGAA